MLSSPDSLLGICCGIRNCHVSVTANEKLKVSVKASSCDMRATPETVSVIRKLVLRMGQWKWLRKSVLQL